MMMFRSEHKMTLITVFVVLIAVGGWLLFTEVRKSEPKAEVVMVTIPESLRKEQTADILAKALGWTEEQEQKFVVKDTARDILHVEGTYPGGTYEFSTASSTYEVASVLLDAAREQYQKYGKGLTPEEWYEVLRVASVYERENIYSGWPPPGVAKDVWPQDVWGWYRSGDFAQSNATVQYVRDSMDNYANKPCLSDTGEPIAEGMVEYPYQGEGEQPDHTGCIHWRLVYEGAGNEYEWWKPITDKDRELRHGYNTFIYKGLPQHPLATPSIGAILSTLDARL